ncbi:hypothetical protein [Cytobacillus purgationiresistens]|uniref:Exodeoxyribonuclease VII small subunit n=1 Tax=Cytobacillus purgationiresistens TaxID=863449 RepID=A0ABU0AJI9_9BACI|nr:hypothetical protein [Cytobacillus purgationiresistens]MDQ0271039.1 exodeoxyribonuclease VII small subunit [Cytobacillus purgationiresistens]
MKPKMVEKDELLLMLKDIYSQLEELEMVLEENLSNIREDWHEQQADRMTACNEKIAALDELPAGKEMVKCEQLKRHTAELKLGY